MFLIVAKTPNKKQSSFSKHRLEFNQVGHLVKINFPIDACK